MRWRILWLGLWLILWRLRRRLWPLLLVVVVVPLRHLASALLRRLHPLLLHWCLVRRAMLHLLRRHGHHCR